MPKPPSKKTLAAAGEHLARNFSQQGNRRTIAELLPDFADERAAREAVSVVLPPDLRGGEFVIVAAGAELYRAETGFFPVSIRDGVVSYPRESLAFIIEAAAHLRTNTDVSDFVNRALVVINARKDAKSE